MEATDSVTAYVRGRIDQDYVSEVAHAVRTELLRHGGTVELGYQPGDATFYGFVFTRLDESVVRVGHSHAYNGVGATREEQYVSASGWVQVALVNWERVYVFPLLHPEGCFVHPSSVQEHLCDNEASAVAISELLNRISATDR